MADAVPVPVDRQIRNVQSLCNETRNGNGNRDQIAPTIRSIRKDIEDLSLGVAMERAEQETLESMQKSVEELYSAIPDMTDDIRVELSLLREVVFSRFTVERTYADQDDSECRQLLQELLCTAVDIVLDSLNGQSICLGRGSFGNVYKGRHMCVPAAVKCFEGDFGRRSLTDSELLRIENEVLFMHKCAQHSDRIV